jgi:hypothetical protein
MIQWTLIKYMKYEIKNITALMQLQRQTQVRQGYISNLRCCMKWKALLVEHFQQGTSRL